MRRFSVGKTVVPHPEKSSFLLLTDNAPVRKYVVLEELAVDIRRTLGSSCDNETRLIKNDLPDIIWKPEDALSDTILECTRLLPDEMHKLARLLRK